MTEPVLEVLLFIFGSIYNEGYYGWGGEDSDLSYKSALLNSKDIIYKTCLKYSWHHLSHPSRRPGNIEGSENYKRFMESKHVIDTFLKKYLEEIEEEVV